MIWNDGTVTASATRPSGFEDRLKSSWSMSTVHESQLDTKHLHAQQFEFRLRMVCSTSCKLGKITLCNLSSLIAFILWAARGRNNSGAHMLNNFIVYLIVAVKAKALLHLPADEIWFDVSWSCSSDRARFRLLTNLGSDSSCRLPNSFRCWRAHSKQNSRVIFNLHGNTMSTIMMVNEKRHDYRAIGGQQTGNSGWCNQNKITACTLSSSSSVQNTIYPSAYLHAVHVCFRRPRT